MKEPTPMEIEKYYAHHTVVETVNHFLAIQKEEIMKDRVIGKTEDQGMDEIDKLLFNEGCKQEKSQPDEVLSFEELKNYLIEHGHSTHSWDYIQRIMKLARQGMIPAKNAIQLPDESEWPEWAKSVKLIYSTFAPSTYNDVLIDGDCMQCIPRSKPKWAPCDGDTVIVWHESDLDSFKPYETYKFKGPFLKDEYCMAKVEQLSDIGHDIAWFKANREWI